MKFNLAEFWGMTTLMAAAFAALRFLVDSPVAFGGIVILSVPVHAVVSDLVEMMSRGRRNHRID